VAGHIDHIYELNDLTFDEMGDILTRIASGEIPLQEKIDGQNITFTVIDGKLHFFTKNPSRATVRTKGGMDRERLRVKYADRPGYANAIVQAYEEIEAVCSSLDLGDGDVLVEAALVTSDNQNVIPYAEEMIVLIEARHESGCLWEGFSCLVERAKESSGKYRFVEVPILHPAPQTVDATRAAVDSIRRLPGLVSEYTVNLTGQLLREQYSIFHLGAARRLVTQNKSCLRPHDLSPAGWKRFQAVEAERGIILGNVLLELEGHIQEYCRCLFNHLDFQLASNDPKAALSIQGDILVIRQAYVHDRVDGTEIQLKHLPTALRRIGDVRKFEKAVEGVVFCHGNHQVKLTGMFAAINKTLGLFRFGNPMRIRQ
jgi:hypothetical protein